MFNLKIGHITYYFFNENSYFSHIFTISKFGIKVGNCTEQTFNNSSGIKVDSFEVMSVMSVMQSNIVRSDVTLVQTMIQDQVWQSY